MSQHFLNKLKSIRQRYGIEKAQNNNFIKIDDRSYQQQVSDNKRRQYSVQKQDVFNKRHQQRQPSLIMYDTNKHVGQNRQKPVIHRSQSTFNKQRQLRMSQLQHLQHPIQQRQLPSYLVNSNNVNGIQSNRKSTDRLFRQKDYNRAVRANNYMCNQPQCLAQKFDNNSRTFSQQKSQQLSLKNNNKNNYDLKYNYDLQNVNNILSSKSNFTSQSLHHRQPLRLLNNRNLIDDHNLNFNHYDTSQKAKYQTLEQSYRQGSFSYGGNRQQSKPDWTIDKLCKVQEKIHAYLRR